MTTDVQSSRCAVHFKRERGRGVELKNLCFHARGSPCRHVPTRSASDTTSGLLGLPSAPSRLWEHRGDSMGLLKFLFGLDPSVGRRKEGMSELNPSPPPLPPQVLSLLCPKFMWIGHLKGLELRERALHRKENIYPV